MKSKKYTRRQFVGSLPCIALGTTTLYSSLINMKAMQSLLGSQATAKDDYKALVCIMLGGGNDSYNMLIPRGTDEYAQYVQVRANNAIAQEDLLAIDPIDNQNMQFGLHPSMTGIQQMFQDGNAAFVCNVGTLVQPTNKDAIIGNMANLPLGLGSHIDQAMHWQTAFPQERGNQGWGGRMADILKSQNSNQEVSMNISLSGNNIFQRGEDTVEYAINRDGGVSIVFLDSGLPFFNQLKSDVSDMTNKEYGDLFKDAYSGVLRRSVESNRFFNESVTINGLNTNFGNGNLAQDLRMVADTIAARNILGAKRQIFFVELGGFDNHDELIGQHAILMERVDNAMTQFYKALEEMGVEDCVTTYTISDFARTLTSNGNGTDHGWGGNAIVMGGAVKGKNLYGSYPDLALGNNLDLGGGVLVPQISTDEYFAELALWFGISPNDLSLILPNIGNFYDVSSNQAPLGFLLDA